MQRVSTMPKIKKGDNEIRIDVCLTHVYIIAVQLKKNFRSFYSPPNQFKSLCANISILCERFLRTVNITF